jgi:two-component system sensor histidine kinase/response regulator
VTGSTPEQAARLDKIDTAGQHLLAVISDVLDLSKIEAGHLQLEHGDFELLGLIDHVRRLLADSARAKGLALRRRSATPAGCGCAVTPPGCARRC